MKKFLHLIVVGFMLLGFFSVHSAPVDTATAKLLAQNFYRQMVQVNSSQRMNLRVIKTFTSYGDEQSDGNVQDTACFYIMNIDSGYVIFAADDRISPILAYSTTSSFDMERIPDNLAFWLEGCRRSILDAIRQDRTPEDEVVSFWRKLWNNENVRTRYAVDPLLTTQWGQGCYYNSMCPSSNKNSLCYHSPTGCGPTAIGQVMKYWNYPPHGVGSVSNSTGSGTPINLENYNFNYSIMPNVLDANSTSAQVSEVSKLMYVLGKAFHTQYGVESSYTNVDSLVAVCRQNFGFDVQHHYVYGNSAAVYANAEVLKFYISQQLPVVLFSVLELNGSFANHYFVLDGYESFLSVNHNFHVVWGEDGAFDGWYDLGNMYMDSHSFSNISDIIVLIPAIDTVTLTSTVGGSASGGGVCRRFNTVTLQATPANGYYFTGWEENGAIVSTNATYSFEVNGNRSLQACFTGKTYTVSATVTPSNSGYVNSVRNFSNTYPRGTSVTLTAQPSSGYTFKHWRNTATNTTIMTNPLTMTVNSNLSLQAVFEESQNYTVTVASNNNSLGVVRIGTSGSTQSGSYAYGQQVTVSATALGNNQFLCWKIGSQTVSAEPTYTFMVTGNTDLNAYFKQSTQYYQVTTSSSPSVGGTTTGGGSFVSGSSVTVSASPSQGYHFVKWTENGNTISNYANYTISSLSSSRNLVANFAQNQTTSSGYVNASASPSNGGYVTGNGTYTVGSSVTLNAYPYSGYTFLYWSQGSTVLSTSSSYTFSMPSGGDVNITASFEVASTDYYIYNYSDLNALRAGVNSGAPFLWNYSTVPTGAEGITFHLANNIDNVGFWIPIGNGNSPFLGTFDGAGHYISGVNMNSGDDYTGFFGYIGSTAEIKNLKVINSDIGGDLYVGGICGYNDGGEINNCRYGGEVSGSQYVGGICGQNTGHIYRCGNYNQDFTVSGSLMVGGITGATTDNFSTVSFCDVLSYGTTANITANSSVGGICGFLSDGIVNNCLSAASEINGGDRTGGICGEVTNYGDVFTSGNVSPIYAANYTGGIVGMMSNGGWIEDCYNSNIVSGSNYVGGICGRLTNNNNNTKITQSYNVGVVYGGSIKGAVCASSTGSITNCFYDKQMCTIGDSYATGKLTVEMVGTSLRSGLGHLWIYRDDRYPVFDGLCVQSRIASAPVFLHYTNANDYETVDAVRSSFTVAVENSSFQWSKYNNSDVVDLSDVANGNISLLHAGAVSLQAHSNLYPAGSVHDDCRKIVDIWVGSNLYRYVSVSADPSGYGSVSGAGTYNNGSSCTVTASPYSGYHFVHWTENGNVVSTDAAYTFTATSNRDLVAHFQVNRYTITATSNPTNGGVTEGSGVYNHGATATLTATPATHYTFSRWTDNGSTISYNTTYSFSVTRDANIVAQYTANNYTITTNVTPSGGGSVSGGGTYVYGTSITLQAIPATGYYFVGWRINNTIVSTSATYVWTVSGNVTVTGVFEKQSYTITVVSNSSSQGGVDGGGVYQYGTSVTVQAFPASGYHFLYWKNNNNTIVSTQSTYTSTVTSNKTYIAFFAADPTPPIVTTGTISNIATNSATSGGNVTATGGKSVTARGVCWSVLHNPTTSSNHSTDGSGLGGFTSSISDLIPNTTYYVRAYATNEIGTAYGNEVSFTTPCDEVNVSILIDNTTVPYGQNTVLNASGASGYVWSTGGTGSSITVSPTAVTTYTVTGTNGYGCATTASVTLNVLPVGDALPCPGHATVTDYDGNVYNTVKIGQQCWMKENLRTTHYEDGTEIPVGYIASSISPYHYIPNNDASTIPVYGRLYNRKAAMHGMSASSTNPSGVQGICPSGWHLPSHAEFLQLVNYMSGEPLYCYNGNSNYLAKALASTTGWVSESTGIGYKPTLNNTSGFSAYPAGIYSYTDLNDESDEMVGECVGFGEGVFFWSTSDSTSNRYIARGLISFMNVLVGSLDKDMVGLSLRCVLGDGVNLPVVTTAQVMNITNNSATCGGNVTYAGNTNVTARGVCWSTSQNPTVNDSHTTNGTGAGNYTSSMTGLMPNTVYYVRAYATNCAGTVYGEQKMFTATCSPISVSITGPMSFCEGNTGMLAVETGAQSPQYHWSDGSGGSSITVGQSGTYGVTVTDASGCQGSASSSVTVQPSPSVPVVIIGDNTSCASPNGTITVATPTGSGYTYSINGGAFQVGRAFHGLGGGTYVVTVRNSSGCEASNQVTVQSMGSEVDAQASSNTPCAGATLSLTGGSATPGVTYSWSGPNGYSSTQQSPQILNVSESQSGVYTVTVTESSTNCTGIAAVEVTVNALPAVAITGLTSFCEGNTGMLAVETGTQSPQYHWSDGSSGSSITVGQSGTYGVTVTDASGCQGSALSSVTVLPPPSVPVVIIGDNTSCASPNGTITVATPTGSGYTYSINGGAFQVGRAFHGLGGGTYVVTVRNSSGCEASNQVTVQSMGSEVDAQASSNTPCAGATLSLTGGSATPGVTYSWSGPNGYSSTQQSPQILNVSDSQAGVYTVTVTETSTNCTGVAAVEVTVNALPAVAITGPTSFCEGNTGTLAAETGVQSPQYHWSDGSGGSSITVGQSGTYRVTVTDASGCQGSASSSVTVQPSPSVPVVIIGDNTSCASPNGTITVATPTGSGYTYSINGGAFQVGRAFHGLGGGTYVVTVRNSSGCEASNQVTVQSMGSEVDAQASSNTPCAGATLSLTGGSATPGVTYMWSGPNGYSSTQQSPQILNVSDSQAGVYTVTVTETSTNCTGVAAVEVTVNTPNVSLLDISDETVCAGENVVLNAVLSGPATGMVSYVWSGPNGFQSTLQSPVIQNVTTECSGTYSVTATATNVVNGESCTATDSKTVIVSLLPQPKVTLSTNKNQSVCAGSPINAISVNVANGTPTVMNLPLGLTYNPTTRKITGTPTTSGTYTIVVSNPTCGTATASGTISIIPLPEASLSDNRDQTVCAGSAIMPIVVTAFNASVSVTNLPAGLSYNPNINRIIGTPTSSGTYMVVVSGGNCGPTTTTGTITVDQPMPCVISVGGNTTICEGNSTVLTASVAGDPDTVTYVWTPSTGIDSTIGANVIANPMVTTTYTVSGNLTKGACTSIGSVQVTVNVNTLPAVSITGPTGVCPGGSVTLNAPEGYNSYQWSNNTHQRSTMINEPGSYSVTVTDANGCQNNASAYVTTLPSPAVPSVVITNNTSCALPNGSIMVTSPIGNFSYSIGGGFQNSPTFTNLSANTYTLEVKNLSGCLSSSQFEVLDVSNDVDAHASATTPCLGEVMLLNGFSATPDVTYAWSGPNGYTSEQQSPQINNVTIDNAGVYTLTVMEVETSCSKIDTVYVSVNVPQHTAVDIEACGSYRWNNTTYSESGNYIYAHEDANGCVQVDTLHLTIYSPQNIAQHITACDSFVWNNSTYYQSGVYMYSHTDEHFCVQVDTLYLTLNEAPVVTTNGNQNIFVGNSVTLSAYGANSYLWSTSEMSSTITVTPSNTTTYSVVGITNGCVSAPVYVMVIVNPCVLTTGDTTAVACDAFTWYEHTYVESGDYGRIFTASTGCDSLVTLHLTVNHGTFNVFTDTVYAPYTWHGQVYDSSGTYIFHYTNENGCNSADTLHLTYYPPYASEFSVTACGSYEWNDGVYLMSGDYVHNYTSVVGSDSVVTLHLIVLPVDTIHERVVTRDSCYQWYGIWYCENGEYTQVFENQYGCDSIHILYLIVNDPVGIDHINMGYHLFVSPNPATSMVNIRIDNENEKIQYVEMLDALGRVVKKCILPEAQNEQQVNMSELSNGIYYMKVYSKSRFLGTVKVVKQ